MKQKPMKQALSPQTTSTPHVSKSILDKSINIRVQALHKVPLLPGMAAVN